MTRNIRELFWFFAAGVFQYHFFSNLTSLEKEDKKIILLCRVVETLKDYAIKALVNTVDHLGSVTYKVNDLLDEKVDEVSGTEFRVSCIEQVCLLTMLSWIRHCWFNSIIWNKFVWCVKECRLTSYNTCFNCCSGKKETYAMGFDNHNLCLVGIAYLVHLTWLC